MVTDLLVAVNTVDIRLTKLEVKVVSAITRSLICTIDVKALIK